MNLATDAAVSTNPDAHARQSSRSVCLAIQQEIASLPSHIAAYSRRLHALLLAQGNSCRQVAEWFGEDRSTVQRWRQAFESGSFAGMQEKRPRSLSMEQWHAVAGDVAHPASRFGFGYDHWNSKLLMRHLEQKYKVRLGVRQCQRLLARMRQDVPPPQ